MANRAPMMEIGMVDPSIATRTTGNYHKMTVKF
jgi:hypothetical protein